MTIKLSTVAISVPVLFLLLLFIFHGTKKNFGTYHIIAPIVIVLPISTWVISNYYLSGWLVYPVSALRTSAKWSVPLDTGLWEKNLIVEWARYHYRLSQYPNEPWVYSWVKNLININYLSDFIIPFILLLILLCSMLTSKARLLKSGYHNVCKSLIALLAFNCLFWIFNAPSPRFIYGQFIVIELILLSLLLVGLSRNFTNVIYVNILVVFVLSNIIHRNAVDNVSWFSITNVLVPQPQNKSGLFHLPKPTIYGKNTANSVDILIVQGNPVDSPLLSTSRPNPDFQSLRLLDKDNPFKGFYIDH